MDCWHCKHGLPNYTVDGPIMKCGFYFPFKSICEYDSMIGCQKFLEENNDYSDEPEVLFNNCYKQALQEIIEEYIGMEGFESKTAPEAYLQTVLKRIYDIAIEALKGVKYEKDNYL